MTYYLPKFPRSVGGKKWRRVLADQTCEALGLRADRLYRLALLSHVERANLLSAYGRLSYFSTIPSRPTGSGQFSQVREVIERLEATYGTFIAAVGEEGGFGGRDIELAAAPGPACDDI